MRTHIEQPHASFQSHKIELLLLALVILAAFAMRIYKLGAFPDTFLADEADNAQDAIRIRYGITPQNGFFGLDWTSQPAFSAYKEAFFITIFGISVASLRLSSALISTLALIPFYILLRRQFSMLASLLTTVLLATNVWYLNFSRSGWNCGDIGFYMLMAMLFLMQALDAMTDTDRFRWAKWSFFAATGFFCALGLYGYPAGRAILPGVTAFFPVAWLFNSRHFKQLLTGYVLLFAVTLALFAPQGIYVAKNWEHFNGRSRVVLILNKPGYQSHPVGTMINQVKRNLQAPWIGSVNNTPQYSPVGEPQLDKITGILTLVGMALSLFIGKFRTRPETHLWWIMMLVGWASTQLFTVNTPNGARGIGYMPTLLYFSAIGIETVLILFTQIQAKIPYRFLCREAVAAILTACLLFVGYGNIVHYVEWQNDPRTRQARYLYVTVQEFPEWSATIVEKAKKKENTMNVGQWRELYPIQDVANPYGVTP